MLRQLARLVPAGGATTACVRGRDQERSTVTKPSDTRTSPRGKRSRSGTAARERILGPGEEPRLPGRLRASESPRRLRHGREARRSPAARPPRSGRAGSLTAILYGCSHHREPPPAEGRGGVLPWPPLSPSLLPPSTLPSSLAISTASSQPRCCMLPGSGSSPRRPIAPAIPSSWARPADRARSPLTFRCVSLALRPEGPGLQHHHCVLQGGQRGTRERAGDRRRPPARKGGTPLSSGWYVWMMVRLRVVQKQLEANSGGMSCMPTRASGQTHLGHAWRWWQTLARTKDCQRAAGGVVG